MTSTILVIEDNASNMKLMRTILEINLYKVIEAETAETGIDISRRYRPKLILMDITLPGMSGIDATCILKKDPLTKDIPVIAVTANATADTEKQAMQAGCEDFIPKPLDVKHLLKSIDRTLENDPTEASPAKAKRSRDYRQGIFLHKEES